MNSNKKEHLEELKRYSANNVECDLQQYKKIQFSTEINRHTHIEKVLEALK